MQQECRDVAMLIAKRVERLGPFELITDGSELPVLAFGMSKGVDNYTVFDVSARLRERGWLVPAYTFPKNREDLAVLRLVVRNGFSRDLADLLLDDLKRAVSELQQEGGRMRGREATSFHH